MQHKVEVTLPSGRTAEIHELSAREQMHADMCVKNLEHLGTELVYYRTLAALSRLGDIEFQPAKSDLELDARLDSLKGSEYDALRRRYREVFEGKAKEYAANASVRELTAREQMEADKCAGGDPRMIGYFRVAMAVERIGDRAFGKVEIGEKFVEHINARIDELTGPEIDGLGALYFTLYGPSADTLKKASSAPSSDSSPTP